MKGIGNMVNKISIIGGDLRIIKLANMLAKDNVEIYTFGSEKSKELQENDKIYKCNSIDEAIEKSEVIIGPVPLSSNLIDINAPFAKEKISIDSLIEKLKGKTFIAGAIKEEVLNKMIDVKVIDIMKREELTILNTVSTAEGAIQIAMEKTPRTIHGSKVLVMGFGRVGKMVAKMLNGLGAKVYCEARKNSDIAWIKAYGYNEVRLNELDEYLEKFDIIINTIPYVLLNSNNLIKVKKECLLIDLASNPGGIDKKAVKELGLNMEWALSLPGKVAPITSAECIKDTLYNLFNEMGI